MFTGLQFQYLFDHVLKGGFFWLCSACRTTTFPTRSRVSAGAVLFIHSTRAITSSSILSGAIRAHLVVHNDAALGRETASGGDFPIGADARRNHHHVAFERAAVGGLPDHARP
jgi:hypothetical protein